MLAVSSRHATQARNFWERRIANPDVWKESDPGVWNNIYCTSELQPHELFIFQRDKLSPSTLGSLRLVLSSPSSDTSDAQC
uniref:Uncharacterized protein n=1 Tax=Timema shepardi TaxID=629360 RepID=A0A7R9B1L3_TIMSH|nr:unnamed protein product [Timema shepardi]